MPENCTEGKAFLEGKEIVEVETLNKLKIIIITFSKKGYGL